MKQQGILALAKQGNARAIALLLTQALDTKSIRVRVVRRGTELHVRLEASYVPDQRLYSRLVYAAMLCLGAAAIKSVVIQGQRLGAAPAWKHGVALKYPVLPAAFPQVAEDAGAGSGATRSPQRSRLSLSALQAAVSRAPVPIAGRSRPATAAAASRLPASVWCRFRLGLSLSALIGISVGLGAGINYLFNATSPQQRAVSQAVLSPAQSIPRSASPLQTGGLASPQPSTGSAAQSTLTLKAVGDIVMGTNYPGDRLPADGGVSLFDAVKPYLGDADIVFGNFESTLTDAAHAAKDVSQNMTFAFRTPPDYARFLQDAGFDILSVANNHSMDFGEPGFADTIAHIEQAGMKAVGQKGQIVYLNTQAGSVAFIGFSYLPDHNLMQDLKQAIALVETAKKQAKVIVISVHAGAEGTDALHTSDRTEYFFDEDRGNLVTFAHTLIDHGADLILGHGPHVPRTLELYRSRLIAYSLGNFMGYRTLSTEGALSNSLILQTHMNTEGEFLSGRVIPVALDASGIPYLDDYFQSVVLIRNLIESDFPVTPLLIDEMGYILRNEAPL